MQVGPGGGGFLENENPCLCTVCCSDKVQNSLRRVDAVSEEARSIFANAIDSVDPGAYKDLIELSDSRSLEKVRDTCCFKSALVILLVLVIASVIFGILANRGDVRITRLLGVGLSMIFPSYLIIVLGYLMGNNCNSEDDKENKVIRALDRSRLRKLAIDHKERWDSLVTSHNELQYKVNCLKKSVTGSAYDGIDRLSRMERELANAQVQYSRLGCNYNLAIVERTTLRDNSEEINSRYDEISRKNENLSMDNIIIKSKLYDILFFNYRKFGEKMPISVFLPDR